MAPEDVRTLLKRRPFKPFVIVMTSDERFPIHHPELVIVGRSVLAVGLMRAAATEPIADNITWLSLDQIVKIEPLELASTT